MIDTSNGLLAALQLVSDAGPALEPHWDPNAARGFSYANTALDDAELAPRLEELASRDYVERIFRDRLSLCPSCGSHALNVREICVECHGSQIVAVDTIVHFRCAFAGPASLFAQEAGGRRCPKCRRLLTELGTDHIRPGDYFACASCKATFQAPDVGGLCLACGERFAADQMNAVGSREVYAYRLTALGRSALAEGRLVALPRELDTPGGGAIHQRAALVDLIDDECRRRRALGSTFGLIVFAIPDGGETGGLGDDGVASRIRPFLAESDKLGYVNDRYLVAVLSGATKRRTRATLERIRGLQLKPVIVEGADTADIVRRLDELAP